MDVEYTLQNGCDMARIRLFVNLYHKHDRQITTYSET